MSTPVKSVKFLNETFKNPIVTVSGTFGFGAEFSEYYDINELGGITLKGLSLKPREGNDPPRIAETPSGMLNSVGLQNPGVEHFLKHDLERLSKLNTVVIANLTGNTVDEYVELARILSDTFIPLFELNVSCPNVKEGGIAFGASADKIYEVTKAVKAVSKKPLIVKLSPNVTDIAAMAGAAKSAGADAFSLINTLIGMRFSLKTGKPILANVTGGLSGPAIFPVALACVYKVRCAYDLPIIGMGGVSSANDAHEMMLAGADLVGIGTANIIDPMAALKIARELQS